MPARRFAKKKEISPSGLRRDGITRMVAASNANAWEKN
jgi:hypothetical protein